MLYLSWDLMNTRNHHCWSWKIWPKKLFPNCFVRSCSVIFACVMSAFAVLYRYVMWSLTPPFVVSCSLMWRHCNSETCFPGSSDESFPCLDRCWTSSAAPPGALGQTRVACTFSPPPRCHPVWPNRLPADVPTAQMPEGIELRGVAWACHCKRPVLPKAGAGQYSPGFVVWTLPRPGSSQWPESRRAARELVLWPGASWEIPAWSCYFWISHRLPAQLSCNLGNEPIYQ